MKVMAKVFGPVVLAFFAAAPLTAHTFAPALLEVRQGTEHTEVRWKQPAVRVAAIGCKKWS